MSKKISQLPDATIPMTGPELIETVQGGVSKKVTKANFLSDLDEINKGSIGENYLVRYDDITGDFYTFNGNILLGKMAFEVGVTTGFNLNGETQMADNNFIDRIVWQIVKNGVILHEGVDYTHDSGGGLIEFTVALATNDDVIIYTTWPFIYTALGRDAIAIPPNWDDFDYDPAHDLEELVPDEWTVKGAAGVPYTAVADGGLKIPSGTDGAIRIRHFTGVNAAYDALIGLDATNTNNSYGNYDFWAQTGSDGTIYVNENTTGSVNTGVQCASGDYLSIWRVGNTVTCRKSTDGSNWTIVHTYTGTTSGDLYPKVDCTFMGARKLREPQGYNLSV